MKAAALFCLAASAVAVPLSATLTPLVASMNQATVDLTNAQVRLFGFHGLGFDLRAIKRNTLSALAAVNDIADALGNGRRLDEIDAAAVVAAANPIAVQISLVVKAVQPRIDLLRSEALKEQAPEIIEASADALDNLVAAINHSVPNNWVKIFHDVNKHFIDEVRDARDYSVPRQTPRPYEVPVPVVPIPAVPVYPAQPYPAPPAAPAPVTVEVPIPAPAGPAAIVATVAPVPASY